MSDLRSEPVFVGKAILADNKLTLDGVACEVRDSLQLASFLQTTSAIIATALATVFDAEVGELVFPSGRVGEFRVNGVEPWEQYSSAALSFRLDPANSKVVTGWCALLCAYARLFPGQSFEPGAIETAWYISTKAYKAAEASPEAVMGWDRYEAMVRTLGGAILRFNGDGDMRNSPWGASEPLILPAPSNMSQITALEIVGAYGGDVIITGGNARAYIGWEHAMSCVNDVQSALRPRGHCDSDYIIQLQVNGIEERFRVSSAPKGTLLRMQPRSNDSMKIVGYAAPGDALS